MTHWPTWPLTFALERAACTVGRRPVNHQNLSNTRRQYSYLLYTIAENKEMFTPIEERIEQVAHSDLLPSPLFLRYDVLVGRSPRMGNATKLSYQSHISLVEDLKPG